MKQKRLQKSNKENKTKRNVAIKKKAQMNLPNALEKLLFAGLEALSQGERPNMQIIYITYKNAFDLTRQSDCHLRAISDSMDTIH